MWAIYCSNTTFLGAVETVRKWAKEIQPSISFVQQRPQKDQTIVDIIVYTKDANS